MIPNIVSGGGERNSSIMNQQVFNIVLLDWLVQQRWGILSVHCVPVQVNEYTQSIINIHVPIPKTYKSSI